MQIRFSELLEHPLALDGRRLTTRGLIRSSLSGYTFAGAMADVPTSLRTQLNVGSTFVELTGVWSAAHDDDDDDDDDGDIAARIVVEQIATVAPASAHELSTGELARRLTELNGELVFATAPLRTGFLVKTFDGLPAEGLRDHDARDPVEQLVRAAVWVEAGRIELVTVAERGEALAVHIPAISASALAHHRGAIVDVIGELQVGEYWPTFGAIEVVPPEIATGPQRSAGYSRSTPPPAAVEEWRDRLTRGHVRARARGTVLGSTFWTYELELTALVRHPHAAVSVQSYAALAPHGQRDHTFAHGSFVAHLRGYGGQSTGDIAMRASHRMVARLIAGVVVDPDPEVDPHLDLTPLPAALPDRLATLASRIGAALGPHVASLQCDGALVYVDGNRVWIDRRGGCAVYLRRDGIASVVVPAHTVTLPGGPAANPELALSGMRAGPEVEPVRELAVRPGDTLVLLSTSVPLAYRVAVALDPTLAPAALSASEVGGGVTVIAIP